MQDDNTAHPATTADAQAPPSPAASPAPSSSRATHSSGSTAIPLAQIQRLEVKMATLFQLVKPWMQRSIVECEARVEQRMEQMMDQKVQAVHKRLDAFELRVLERPPPTVDVTTLKKELESLHADVVALLTPQILSQSLPLRHRLMRW